MSISLVFLYCYFECSEQQEPSHGQATDMDMKAFEDFWKIFAVSNFKKS